MAPTPWCKRSPLSSAPTGGLSAYHWLVIAAAWAGWGFDVFDALLFNFVAPNCIPVLLHLPLGSPAAREGTAFWTGAITSILLVGWAAGGVIFGWVCDRIGRKRALFLTIALYAVGTALCAFATNIWELVLFRTLASLGIGGEWGIGATLVAEAVPENRRVEAGVILQTASPLGLMLATVVNYEVAGVWLAGSPEISWRYVFLAGLAPVIVAFGVRLFVEESAHWVPAASPAARPTPRELFRPELVKRTTSGIVVAVTAVVTWWASNAFLPLLGGTLAAEHATQAHMAPDAARLLMEAWKAKAANAFNIGGLAGALAAVPLARLLGRRRMYVVYFLFAAGALFATFGADLAPQTRLTMLHLVGAGVYGVFGTFPFYLPELFPARLRGTGSGLCYNIGRVFAAAGPFLVGIITAAAGGSSAVIIHTLFWLGLIPLAAAISARWLIVETRHTVLPP
ncbi:MAG TPA: MFS transporter [Steroidobacteraceae bacterium]|nr:MFS transporter [Steroidobacteraceae bacterium]